MVTYRVDRLNKEFLREIADILSREVKNDDAASAVLTSVDASADLSWAKVYFTLFDESRKDTVKAALESVAGRVRGALGRRMYIRRVPELRFIFDDSERKAREMDSLIDRVMKGTPAAADSDNENEERE